MSTISHYDLRALDGTLLAWLQPRPGHCLRGRFHAQIEAVTPVNESDPWPRYYFILENALGEVRAYLRCRGVAAAADAVWHSVPTERDDAIPAD